MQLRRNVALLMAVPAIGAASGCGSGAGDGDASAASQSKRPVQTTGWTRFVDDRRGLQLEFPSSWRRARSSLTPFLVDPREVASVGTGLLVANGETGCAQMPVAALQRLGPDDTLVTVMEARGRPFGFPKRPRPFTLGSANQSEALACLSDPVRLDTWWRPFRDGDRAFYALVAIGRPSTVVRRRTAERVLDSLRFTAPRGAR